MTAEDFIRPRLVLDASLLADGAKGVERLRAAVGAGDVATVFLAAGDRSETAFQDLCETLVPLIQEAGAAAIVAEDTRCAGRVKADGFHTGAGSLEALGDAVARFAPRLIVGGSGFTTRHDALEAGERMPDYLLFGKLGADNDAEPHRRNLDLAEWWAEIVEIPCIVQGGASLESLDAAIGTGAEFVMLGRAVLAEGVDPAEAVTQANRLFDEAQARAKAA